MGAGILAICKSYFFLFLKDSKDSQKKNNIYVYIERL